MHCYIHNLQAHCSWNAVDLARANFLPLGIESQRRISRVNLATDTGDNCDVSRTAEKAVPKDDWHRNSVPTQSAIKKIASPEVHACGLRSSRMLPIAICVSPNFWRWQSLSTVGLYTLLFHTPTSSFMCCNRRGPLLSRSAIGFWCRQRLPRDHREWLKHWKPLPTHIQAELDALCRYVLDGRSHAGQ